MAARLRLALVLGTLAFALAPTALAKGPDTAVVCGRADCVTFQAPEQTNALALHGTPFLIRDAPRPAPFYTIELTSSRGETAASTFVYVPSARALLIDGDYRGGQPQTLAPVTTSDYWITAPRATVAVLARATAVLAPHEASPRWTARDGDGSTIWSIAALAGAAALVVVAVVALRKAPSRRPRVA